MKHIVLFQLVEQLSAAELLQIMHDFKAAIEALPREIPTIQHIEVGLNTNPSESWDMALVSEFADLEALRFYATHPAHVAAAGIIKGFVKARSCVDY